MAGNLGVLFGGPYATIKGLLDRLPGRTEEAIAIRRRRLGIEVVNSNHKRPEVIGARPLIAKTCTRCGLLLQADWFVYMPGLRQWSPSCKKCRSSVKMEQRNATPEERARSHKAAAQSLRRQQALTIDRASHAGQPWIKKDHEVLADPDLTILQKALRLRRSYAATRTACSRNGYKSHVGLGDPDRDVWIIDNPNEQKAS